MGFMRNYAVSWSNAPDFIHPFVIAALSGKVVKKRAWSVSGKLVVSMNWKATIEEWRDGLHSVQFTHDHGGTDAGVVAVGRGCSQLQENSNGSAQTWEGRRPR